MSKVIVAFVLAAVVLGGAVSAQDRPDFSGRWELAPAKSTPEGSLGALGNVVTLRQSATALTANTTISVMKMTAVNGQTGTPERVDALSSTVYTFDGAEHELQRQIEGMSFEAPPGAMNSRPPAQMYRATWTTGQLVIITTSPGSLLLRVSRMALSLEADGSLAVEAVSILQPQPNAPKQNAPSATRSIYLKMKD